MKIGFALEYSLGHVTHAQNLKRTLSAAGSDAVQAHYVDLPYDAMTASWARLPLVRSNWSVRASLGARLGLAPELSRLDRLFFHTQVTSLFSADLLRRRPGVVSLDATPLQYDALGAFYNHHPGNPALERFKKRLNERAFTAARRLVTWSQWAKDSLVADYGQPAEKIVVIPPGIDVAAWDFASRRAAKSAGAPIELLFVGGDFPRKGGDTLLAAFEQLPETLRRRAHLHLVTKSEVATTLPNVTVHHGLTPNSPGLIERFAQADLFVFPTRGDCLPLAILEAMAAGLPIVATAVGAIPEAVRDGQTGRIVPLDAPAAMADAMAALIDDGALRQRLGCAAREAAQERFSAARNYVDLVRVASEA